jgi:hypothetical protein
MFLQKSSTIKLPHCKSFLLVLFISSSAVKVQAETILPGLSVLSETDIQESAIAFVNMSTSPGLEGATLTVDNKERHSEQIRGSFGFSAEVTLKDHIFNGYWGLAVVGGSLDDELKLIADSGEPVNLDVSRNVLGLRGSLGLSFPVDQNFKLRPYLSLAVTDLKTETVIDGLTYTDPSGYTTTTPSFRTSAQLASVIGSLDALYSRWYGDNKLELTAQYNLIYTDAFSEDNPVLSTYDLNHTVQLKSRYTGPTDLVSVGRPWRWQAYANYTNFISHNKASLGYQSLVDFGGGLEWEMNIKPLDWFGWQMLGIRAGLIYGDNVEGYKFGLTAR